MPDVTRILKSIEDGDPKAAGELLPLVYDKLRELAAVKMAREKPGQTLSATSLVHDAYIRLVDVEATRQWNGRSHFFAAAAEAMRRILIEQARRKQSERHGGGRQRVPYPDVEITVTQPHTDILALDEALERFAKVDRVAADLVKLRYFAGLSIPEAAEALGISRSTADRYWTYARAWLHAELENSAIISRFHMATSDNLPIL